MGAARIIAAVAIGRGHAQQTTIYGPNGAAVDRETRSGNLTTLVLRGEA
jgi:hypothetical protein